MKYLIMTLIILFLAKVSLATDYPSLKRGSWPPKVSEIFPSIDLISEDGATINSELILRGKRTLIEFVASQCAGCNMFAGGMEFGKFPLSNEKLQTDGWRTSIEDYILKINHFDKLPDDFQVIQIMIFDHLNKAPTAKEIKMWSEHFHFKERGLKVYGVKQDLAIDKLMEMIPLFYLLDESGKVIDQCTIRDGVYLFDKLIPKIKEK